MDMSKFVAGEYLKKEDVTFQGTDSKILGVKLVQIQGEDRPLLGLDGLKPLVLNKINIRILSKMYGNMSEDWSGQVVNIYADPTVTMAGQVVGGVRVRPGSDWNPAPRETPAAAPVDTVPRQQSPAPEYVPGSDEDEDVGGWS